MNARGRSRIIFAGTPEFAAVSLRALVTLPDSEVIAVYTQPDRPAGRGRKLTPSPVKAVAADLGIPVRQPQSLRDDRVIADVASLQPDLMVVAAYGLILPTAVLAVPRLGCVNIHASLLPRWRGAAPIQRALLAGDCETGITLMQMDAGLDTGCLLKRAVCPILPADTAQSLHDRLAVLGAHAIATALPDILAGRLHGETQDAAFATYAAKVSREESVLDFNRTANELERAVRAYFPRPGASIQRDGALVRLLEVDVVTASCNKHPSGAFVRDGKELMLTTGEGLLRIRRLQLPGGRPISGTDYLNAQHVALL